MWDMLKPLLGGSFLVLIGLGMAYMPFTAEEGEFSVTGYIFMVVFGLLFVVVGVFLVGLAMDEMKGLLPDFSGLFKKKGKDKKAEKKEKHDKGGAEPRDMFSGFRGHYADFLKSTVSVQNPPVQNDVTQFFRNILELRRGRIQKLGVECAFSSCRIGRPPYKSSRFSDGKYDIEEYDEDILATTEYLKGGRRVYSKTEEGLAHYTVSSARTAPKGGEVFCPNCGAAQKREQLLDGCDYCGTKFMVEDLDKKISDFSMRSDYREQYKRYKEARRKFLPYIGIAVEVAAAICFLIYGIFNGKELFESAGGNYFLFVAGIIFASVVGGIPFAFIALACFCAFIFPIIQMVASFNYVSKWLVERQKKADRNNVRMQEKVRKSDTHFSVTSFHSNVQNKMASIHFANSKEQINAFAVRDISGMLGKYKNVIDVETEYINLKDYKVEAGMQKARVKASLRLVMDGGKKCRVRHEKVRMTLVKSADCKTQVVRGPRAMTCPNCGASISFLEGKKCSYCGGEMDLSRHDWAVQDYSGRIRHIL